MLDASLTLASTCDPVSGTGQYLQPSLLHATGTALNTAIKVRKG